MSLFHPIKPAELARNFTHYGWAFGFVPVYIGALDGECLVSVRNWCPEWPLDLVEALYFTLVAPFQAQPGIPMMLTGRIDGKPEPADVDPWNAA